MFTKYAFRAAIAGALLSSPLIGCSHAQTALSPLVGTWQINGDTPPPAANLPRFTRLRFKSDGTVSASYVAAAGALAHVAPSAPHIKQEQDSYTISEPSTLHIIEGSRALVYTYEIHDDRLLLTSADGDTGTAYVRVTSTTP